MIFCFVEFTEPKCALTAMEALQGKCFFFVNITEFDVYPQGPQENIYNAWYIIGICLKVRKYRRPPNNMISNYMIDVYQNIKH